MPRAESDGTRRPAPARLPTAAGSLRSRRVVARRVAVRGVRRGDPGPEHRLGQRRAHARVAASAVASLLRGARPPLRAAARAAPPLLGDLPREGAAAAGLPRLPGRGVRRAGRGDEGGRPARALRRKLLAVPGIGPETADSIALYAAGKPLFVVDAYTRRVFARLGLLRGDRAGELAEPPRASWPFSSTRYDQVQRFLMDRLPRDAALYNDYHAQLVRLGKDHCRPRPRCAGCPLDDLCPKRGVPSSPRARVVILRSSDRARASSEELRQSGDEGSASRWPVVMESHAESPVPSFLLLLLSLAAPSPPRTSGRTGATARPSSTATR